MRREKNLGYKNMNTQELIYCMEFQSLAKQALPLHRQNVVAELVPKGLPWSSAKFLFGKKSKGEGVSEGVKSLYEYIESNPGQRVTHFEETLKKPGKTIERWIKILRDRKK